MVIHHIQRFLEGRSVVAAVVTEPGSGQVRKLAFAGKVFQTQLGGIHFELECEQIHHALDAVGGLGAPRSAIRVSGNAVGKDAHDIRDHIAEFIKPGHHEHRKRGDGRRQELVIRAQVLNQLEPQTQNRAVAASRNLVIINVTAAVDGAQKILAARLDPLHGLADFHGHKAHERFFGVNIQLAAEAATHFRCDHAHPVFRKAQHLRHQRTQQVWNLRGRVEREIFFRAAVIGYHSARFHGSGDQALAGDALLNHHFGLFEGLFGLAAFLMKCERGIVGPFRVNRRRAGLERFLGIRHRL